MLRFALIALGAVLCFSTSLGDPAAVGLREQLDVDRVLLPLTLEGSQCSGIRPDNLRVTEDRQPVPRVTAIETIDRSTIHALLLDVSGSMEDHGAMDRAVAAAQRYVDAMPAGEQIMLVTFSDDVRLRVPLMTVVSDEDRQIVHRELGELGAGGGTAMRDAVYTTLRFLATFPQRKAMILLTDGVDSSSPQLEGAFVEHATDVGGHDVAIFPIGLNIKKTSGAGKLLERLATRTGGVFYPLIDSGGASSAQGLADTFDTIRSLLLQQVVVEYQAHGWGASKKERRQASRGQAAPARRRVRVEVTGVSDCQALHYRDHRWVRPERQPAVAENQPFVWPPQTTGTFGPLQIPLSEQWRELYGKSVPPEAAWLTLETTGQGAVRGSSLDFTGNSGMFYVKTGSFHSYRKGYFPRFTQRPFQFEPPPLERMFAEQRSIDEALFEMIDRADFDEDRPATERAGMFVAGSTLPWLREPIAAALFGGFAEYQNWIAYRLEADVRYEVERFVSARLVELWQQHASQPFGVDLPELRIALWRELRAGVDSRTAARWAAEITHAVQRGASPSIASLLTEDKLARGLRDGLGDDLARFCVEALVASRMRRALEAEPWAGRVRADLEQIDAIRPLLVARKLRESGDTDYARYAADWLPDITPYELATGLEAIAVNRWLAGERDEGAQERFASGWKYLSELLSPSGLRTRALLLPVYDARRERIGFHRVSSPGATLNTTGNVGIFRRPVITTARVVEPFPGRPWALELARRLAESTPTGHRIVETVDHRVVPRSVLIEDLLAPIDQKLSEMSDWQYQAPRIFLPRNERGKLRSRREALDQQRRELLSHRERVAHKMHDLFDTQVIEIEIGWRDIEANRGRTLAYAPASPAVQTGKIESIHCLQPGGLFESSKIRSCDFLSELEP